MLFFFFPQVCFNIKALKLPQGLQICMNQPEVTLRPRGKLKMPTFMQLLIRTLSQNREIHRVSKHTACTAEAFPIEKKVSLKSKHVASNKRKADKRGGNGGKGTVAEIC